MKYLIFSLVLLLAMGATINNEEENGPSILKKYNFDANYPLYLSDGQKFGFNEVGAALDKAFSYNQPVLLFVHGRGNEPNKSLVSGTFVEGGAVRKLETQYKVRVLMFNWESKAFMYDRSAPLSRMPAAGESLKKVLTSLKNYLALPQNQSKKLTMLAHSMGSIVVQTMVQQQGGWPVASRPLFSQVVLTSPDADNVKHWEWLNDVSQNEKVFVTINRDDDILEKSDDSREEGREPLGLVPVLPLSSKAIYLDISKLGDKPGKASGVHEVFNKENMKGQVNYCNVFDQLLTGRAPVLAGVTDPTEQINYLKVKFAINKNDKCLVF
ncbi:MAG: alpha/beta hydrolase [Pseudobdellovibrio sp.]